MAKKTMKVEIDLEGKEVVAVRVNGRDITDNQEIISIADSSSDEWMLQDNDGEGDLILVRGK